MTVGPIASDEKLASALAKLGTNVLGTDAIQILQQIVIAAGNITGGGGGTGTMAQQNADVVAITGGTIDGVQLNDALITNSAITGTTVSGLTFTSAAVGFTIAGGTTSKTLTVLNTGTAALLEIAQTFSAANIFSVNGAASTPAVKINGSWFTGGSATTTKPQFLVEPNGTTSTTWDTNGTGIGVNAASGFSGSLIDLQKSSLSYFRIVVDSPNAGSTEIWLGSSVRLTNTNATFSPNFTTNVLGDISDANRQWNGVVIRSAAQYLFSSDTGIARTAAGAVKITNGSSGYGTIDASGYSASGTAGVTAGPFTAITSITVKNGLVTAITGT